MSSVILKQFGDGTASLQNNADAVDDVLIGGPAAPTVLQPRYLVPRRIKIPMNAGADTGGGLFAWANPHAYSVIIEKVTLDFLTKTTGTCTLDVGITATSATTAADTLIDGCNANATTTVTDNIISKGTNGLSAGKVLSGKWITATASTGTSTGLVAFAYIEYFPATT